MHNFNLINKYKTVFNLKGYFMGNYSEISHDFLAEHQDTGLIITIREKALQDLRRMIEQRMEKKKSINIEKVNELIIVIDDIADIFNQIHCFRIILDKVIPLSQSKSFIKLQLENDTQKEVKKLKDKLKEIIH